MLFLAPLVIMMQPAPRAQYVGEQATFSVVVQTPGASFQWRRNGVAIAGATTMIYTTPVLVAADDNESIDVVVTAGAESVTSKAATVRVGPFATTYTTRQGETVPLYAWPGRSVAVLTQSTDLNPATMRSLLAAVDATWDYYAATTGSVPKLAEKYEGRAILAQVPAQVARPCAAECVAASGASVELSYEQMRALYTGIAQATYDRVLFEQMGRIFWLYGDQLAYKPPDSDHCVVAGYALLMRTRALRSLNTHLTYDGSGNDANGPSALTEPLVDVYAASPTLNWANTFRTDVAPPVRGARCADLFASMMDKLMALNGGEAFLQSFLLEAAKRPAAKTTQDAVDNFVLAASAAAKHSLVAQFETQWKWPVSKAAEDEARRSWPTP